MTAARTRACPPAVPFVFAIGVTGHRKEMLAPSSLLTLHERLRTVLATLARKASEAHAANRKFFSPDPSRQRFDVLLSRATCSLELPGGGEGLDAYVMAGRATIAHSDVVIAVWDG